MLPYEIFRFLSQIIDNFVPDIPAAVLHISAIVIRLSLGYEETGINIYKMSIHVIQI